MYLDTSQERSIFIFSHSGVQWSKNLGFHDVLKPMNDVTQKVQKHLADVKIKSFMGFPGFVLISKIV